MCQKSSYDSRVKPIFANSPQTSSQTVHGRFTNCLWINKTIKGTLQSVDFSAGRAICRFFCRSCNLSIFLQVVQSVDFSAGRAICRFFFRPCNFSAGRAICRFFCRPCNLSIFLQAVQFVDFSAGRATPSSWRLLHTDGASFTFHLYKPIQVSLQTVQLQMTQLVTSRLTRIYCFKKESPQ